MIDPKLAHAFTTIRAAFVLKPFKSETLKREILDRISDLEQLLSPVGDVMIQELGAEELIEMLKEGLAA